MKKKLVPLGIEPKSHACRACVLIRIMHFPLVGGDGFSIPLMAAWVLLLLVSFPVATCDSGDSARPAANRPASSVGTRSPRPRHRRGQRLGTRARRRPARAARLRGRRRPGRLIVRVATARQQRQGEQPRGHARDPRSTGPPAALAQRLRNQRCVTCSPPRRRTMAAAV